MRIVGLDLSLSSTGVALGIDGKLQYSRLVLGQGSGIPRLIAGRQNVMEQVEEAKPDLILIEDLTYSLNKSYAKENAGFSYSIQMELVTDKIPYCVVSNTSLKKFCCGTAGSKKNPIKKEHILKDVLRVFGHNIDSNDEADAIVLAYMGMALIGQWNTKNDPQSDSLVVIHKSNPWLKQMARPA